MDRVEAQGVAGLITRTAESSGGLQRDAGLERGDWPRRGRRLPCFLEKITDGSA